MLEGEVVLTRLKLGRPASIDPLRGRSPPDFIRETEVGVSGAEAVVLPVAGILKRAPCLACRYGRLTFDSALRKRIYSRSKPRSRVRLSNGGSGGGKIIWFGVLRELRGVHVRGHVAVIVPKNLVERVLNSFFARRQGLWVDRVFRGYL